MSPIYPSPETDPSPDPSAWRSYITARIVAARPCSLSSFNSRHGKAAPDVDEDGYEIRYPDGYESWCPSAAWTGREISKSEILIAQVQRGSA